MKRLCYSVLICIEEVVLPYIAFSFSVQESVICRQFIILKIVGQSENKKMASEQSTGLIVK